jgi:hypothetical protein
MKIKHFLHFSHFTKPPVRALCWQIDYRAMPKDPFIREKFTKERSAARTFAKEYPLACFDPQRPLLILGMVPFWSLS